MTVTSGFPARSTPPIRSTTAPIEHAALHSPEFIKFSEGKRAKKVIVVPGRLVNIVSLGGRVALLGGGMAGVAAAWELSRPGWRERFDGLVRKAALRSALEHLLPLEQ